MKQFHAEGVDSRGFRVAHALFAVPHTPSFWLLSYWPARGTV